MPSGVYVRTEEHKRNLGNAHRGYKFTKEQKERLSLSHMGQPGYWTGKHRSKETLKKMTGSFKEGHTPWNKGLTKRNDVRIENYGKKIRGENHPNWGGGRDSFKRRIRFSFKYRQWRSDVFTRDEFICQECGHRGGKLNAHHIEQVCLILELNDIKTYEQAMVCSELWNINNGITLCEKCHWRKKRR